MSNLKIYLPAVDGSAYFLQEEDDSCKDAIHMLFTDDFAAPPTRMVIEVATESGKNVKVNIPYDANGQVSVQIDDVEV